VLASVNVLDAKSLVSSFGEVGVLVALFVETGLLVGFFLPGDSLLFVAGFAAAGKVAGVSLSLGLLLVLAAVGAILGAQTGFLIGRRAGRPLVERPDSRLFKTRYVTRTEAYLERFGTGKAVVIARFVPVVRTFTNPLVGISDISTRDFAVWNVVGGVAWTSSVVLAGYFLGSVPFVSRHLELLIVAIVVVSVVPLAVETVRHRRGQPASGRGARP